VDSPVLPSLRIFAGAVEGIDDPHPPCRVVELFGVKGLFRSDAIGRKHLAEALHEELMRELITLFPQRLA
jgi:hypothetical protein